MPHFFLLNPQSSILNSSHYSHQSNIAQQNKTSPARMGFPSFAASNAVIYVTYGAFLLMGTGIAWKMRNQSKADFLSGNGTQTGQNFQALRCP
ncbi:hypothetical protein LB507_010486 [Fusarium sp. FIESC RH6]|nr:hypothetical protein LB507_010486 [Fusarium sp. FIESC RH6]